jgi:dihydroflavonol-4-reductase
MTEANLGTTARVLDAAAEAGTPRVVHLSTYGIYGDTGGRVVDESYRRDPGGYLSWYDETKHRAHLLVEERIAAGAPAILALLGAAYGPGDPSGLGDQLRRAAAGRLPAVGSPTLGVSWTHVDDLADGIVRMLERGEIGGAYNLGGEIGTLRDGIREACRAAGRRPPRVEAPATALRALGRLGPSICRRLGFPANLGEAVRCTDGVTYWATHARAATELGYAARPMREGFEETFGRG